MLLDFSLRNSEYMGAVGDSVSVEKAVPVVVYGIFSPLDRTGVNRRDAQLTKMPGLLFSYRAFRSTGNKNGRKNGACCIDCSSHRLSRARIPLLRIPNLNKIIRFVNNACS